MRWALLWGAMAVRKGPPPDLVIATLAERQHGVLARRQLLEAGTTRDAIERRLRDRRLLPLHAGVYAAGHAQLTRGAGGWRRCSHAEPTPC